ncbi:unnamed protein product, partial [Laminaria digitata]
ARCHRLSGTRQNTVPHVTSDVAGKGTGLHRVPGRPARCPRDLSAGAAPVGNVPVGNVSVGNNVGPPSFPTSPLPSSIFALCRPYPSPTRRPAARWGLLRLILRSRHCPCSI